MFHGFSNLPNDSSFRPKALHTSIVSRTFSVCILAALLRKPTYLYPSSHAKICGVYEYSMSEMPDVQLLTEEDI